tara:strand:- start:193 stop:468 length:276 start_codon:yes stop_codon:yes gene_type:complete
MSLLSIIFPYNKYITNKGIMTKTQTIINRILQVDNFQNVACYCSDWKDFVQELAEWGVDGCAKIDFDDPELNIPMLDAFIKSENGYIREGV